MRALRQSCRFDRARIDSGKTKSKPVYRIPSNKQADAMAMFDYCQIPQGLFSWIFVLHIIEIGKKEGAFVFTLLGFETEVDEILYASDGFF